MKLSKEELKERNVIAASIRFYEDEQKNVRKYQLMSVAAMLIAIAIGVYIYVDSGACFRNYKKGIVLSLFTGLILMWGYYTWAHMHMNKYLTPYVNKTGMKGRIEELGGLDSVPKSQSSFIKNVLLWFVIAVVVMTILNNVQL